MTRKPAVAGQFYPADPEELRQSVKRYIKTKPEIKKEKVLGIVVPHAGYIYSGKVAGAVYGVIEPADSYVLIGPNHQGFGVPASMMTAGEWQLPGGTVEIDEELATRILKGSKFLKDDVRAQLYEHSLEVQIPFLQELKKDSKIVPIVMRDYSLESCEDIGISIARAAKEKTESVIVVASSDLTHYQPQAEANRQDKFAVDRILQLDPAGLLKVVEEKNISMCGSGPTAVMLVAAKDLGAGEAELVLYQTSGDVTGDFAAVVGYAGVIVK